MQNCHLGQHVPLEKGISEEGIVMVVQPPSLEQPSPSSGEDAGNTEDPSTNTRHGEQLSTDIAPMLGNVCLHTYLHYSHYEVSHAVLMLLVTCVQVNLLVW